MARALVVGEALVDVVVGPEGQERGRHPGGSPLNVAIGLSRLGHEATLLTRLAADEPGRLVLDHLAASGVRLARGSLDDGTTSRATARLDEDGVASYEFVLDWRLPSGGDELLGDAAGASPVGDDAVRRSGPPRPVDLVHTGSIAAVLPPGAAAVEALLRAADGGPTISYDPNARPALMGAPAEAAETVRRFVTLSDVVKVSDEDLGWLHPEVDPLDVAQSWRELGPALVVVTRGGDGAEAVGGFGRVRVDTPPTIVADTVGAGDAFSAGLLDALARHELVGQPRREALRTMTAETARRLLRHAALVASITCSRPGADPPWRHELPLPSPAG